MTEIRDFFTNLFIFRQRAFDGKAAAPSADKSPENTALAERTVLDTVTLTEGGQKIVNLARGRELADQIRSAPVDENFAANLVKAQEDILRINTLFTETIKTAFLPRQ